ncbi:MAG: gamma-glutamylcyclotransferase [Desulfobulbaceae bacterium]|nr:gamma-glutamylcyclotransferase [Desulfobulbaceae bacterium]
MKTLFAYGSLMCKDIMQEISACSLSHVAGTLKGYSRRCVKGEHYPALVPDAPGRVEGVVYRNVPDSAWKRLDRFEGEMYERRLVEIEINDGTIVPAETYVVHPEFLNRVDSADWDFADFLRSGKALFKQQYKGYRKL